MKKISIIIAVILPITSFCQEYGFMKNFNIDLGMGVNTYREKAEYIPPEGAVSITRYGDSIPIPAFRHKGMASFLTYRPSIRFNYRFPIVKIAKEVRLELAIFTGYYTSGGGARYIALQNQYRINRYSYNFHSLEIGVNPGVNFGKCYVGGLVKLNYMASAKLKTFHGIGNISKMDLSHTFRNYSTSVGINCQYMAGRFSIGVESVFGLTNLYSEWFLETREPWTYSIRDISARVIFGFRFK